MTTLNRIGDEAVRAKTGRGWDEWIGALDRAGALGKAHKEIVAIVRDRLGLQSGWWCQMVTVGYEQAKGSRMVNEKPGGFEVNATKTVAVPLALLFDAWHDDKTRRRWLGDSIVIRKATPVKSLRITWSDGSDVSVNFYSKGKAKSQVAAQHGKLSNAKAAAAAKVFWSAALVRLKDLLER